MRINVYNINYYNVAEIAISNIIILAWQEIRLAHVICEYLNTILPYLFVQYIATHFDNFEAKIT